MDNITIKTDIIKTCNKFLNEISISYDHPTEKYSLYLDEKFEEFVEESIKVLKEYSDDLTYLSNTKEKVKTVRYHFLQNIILFGGQFKFDMFKDENKSTKKSVVKYLHSLYTLCFLYSLNGNTDSLNESLEKLIEQMQINQKESLVEEVIELPRNEKMSEIPKFTQMPNLNGMEDVFKSLMSNNGIMSIATELSKDIQKENIDPMSMLSGLMSGRPDEKLQNMITNITGKIESKINSGEIDKEELEKQAASIISNVKKNS